MTQQISVIKRSGKKVPFDLSKWQAQIAKVCEGVADVSPSMIEIASQAHFHDGMTTRELDQIALRSMVNLIDEEENPDIGNVNYQYVAGKQRISMLRKDVYGDYTPPPLFEIVKKNVELKLYTHELLQWYSEEEWNQLNRWIDHEKDETLPYAAVEQLIEKYLVRNRSTGMIVETPQVRYMIAAATAFHAETKDRLKYVKEFYQAASDGMFTLATPVLAGLGTKTKQFSSCVLLRTDDTLKSIFATGQVMADYASKRAGIGLEIGRMRPLGAEIRGGEVMHTGILPFMKKWYADLRSCSQGGIRNASATVNMPIWHYQFDDFIVLKNNQGTEETRVRQLDYCVVMNAFFWRRFREKGNITFFDPNQVPDLYEAFYRDTSEFEKLYVEYEKRDDLRKKVESAETVIKDWVVKERGDTGRYYILNIDNVANEGPFDTRIHPIYQTNLCFSGDTLVAVADGRNAVSMKELEELGAEFNVFSARRAGGKSLTRGRRSGGKMITSEWKTVIRKARVIKTGVRELVRVHLEDGDFFDATPDHRLATTSFGEWVEAGNSVGAELEPFATYAIGAKYRGIQSQTGSYQHRWIWEHAHGAVPTGHDVDHLNRAGDDALTNLQVLPRAEHLLKTAQEVAGVGNNIHRVDNKHLRRVTSRSSFLQRNSRYSGFTDEQLVELAREYAAGGGKLRVNELVRYFSSIGAPMVLSKNRFQRYKDKGFSTRWGYLIACAQGAAEYLPPVDYTADTVYRYEQPKNELGWTWVKDGDTIRWAGRRVARVEPLGEQPCYDVQVLDSDLTDDEHNFYIITSGNDEYRTSKGVLVHNCTEIMLPTAPFNHIEDAGELTIEYRGKDLVIPNTATAKLADGTTKLVRFVNENDDVLAFLFEDGRELVLQEG